MPQRPDRRQNQTRDQRRMLPLQTRKREAAPPRFFAEPDEEQDEYESLRQFARRRRGWQSDRLTEHRHDAHRGCAKQNRQAENDRVGREPDSGSNHSAEQGAHTRAPVGDPGHNQRRDQRSQRIRSGRGPANERDDPWVPGEEESENEEGGQIVPGNELAEFARANRGKRDGLSREVVSHLAGGMRQNRVTDSRKRRKVSL